MNRDQPFSGLYEIGPDLVEIIGDDEPNVRMVKAGLDDKIKDPAKVARYLNQLIEALALWKLDGLLPEKFEDPPVPAERAKPPADYTDLKAMTGVLPPNLCGYRSLTGVDCDNFAVPGSVRCGRHGGAITDPEVRSSLLLLAYSKLVDHTDVAVEALIDVAQNSRTDMARVQAAKELLDRAGIVQDSHIHVHGADDDETDRPELIDRLRKQLDSTKDRLQLVAIPTTAHEQEDDEATG